MVKRLFFSLVAIAVATFGFAQDIVPVNSAPSEDDGGVVPKSFALTLGPKVGANYSLVNDPSELNFGLGSNVGFSGGLTANVRFGKRPRTKFADTGRFGIQLEATYAMRSIKSDIENIDMSNIEIPLLFQWWFARDFCIAVGPTFTGVLTTSPEELSSNNAVYKTGKIKGYDVMLTIGADYKSKKGLTASLRYNMGNSELAGNFPIKVSTISAGIGWLFSIAK